MINIRSRDYWIKVVDFLQCNWALVDEDANSGATIFFMHELSGVFDTLTYPTKPEAELALRRNGFERIEESPYEDWRLAAPKPPFKPDQHPNGRIYSSGRFWRGLPSTASPSEGRLFGIGVAIGDMAGSCFEKTYIKELPVTLITGASRFTDDTVLTCAVAEGLKKVLLATDRSALRSSATVREEAVRTIAAEIREYALRYPHAGFGRSFKDWLRRADLAPYNSFGNGAAMRVSFAGWCAKDLEEARLFGELTSRTTHDHPEAVKGASVVAACIYILKSGGSKKDVVEYARRCYDLSFTLDALRPIHSFNVTCAGTVPVSIVSFLESTDFCHMIRLAVSMGGDTDTLAAIAGAIGEAYYSIPDELQETCVRKLDPCLLRSFRDSTSFLSKQGSWTFQQNPNAEPMQCRCLW